MVVSYSRNTTSAEKVSPWRSASRPQTMTRASAGATPETRIASPPSTALPWRRFKTAPSKGSLILKGEAPDANAVRRSPHTIPAVPSAADPRKSRRLIRCCFMLSIPRQPAQTWCLGLR